MKFEKKLVRGTLVKRYKRFLADVTLEDGSLVTAHCPNTGSMKSCWQEGDKVYLTPSDDPKRKLKYTWELSKTEGGYIGINTNRPNKIVFESIENDEIHKLKGYKSMRREVKYGKNSRIDILLEGKRSDPEARCWVEIKNATLLDEDLILFPDAVTDRGLKHILELQKKVEEGDRAVMFYLVNRPEGKYFSPAKDIDPKYAEALKQAKEAGLEIMAYRVRATPSSMSIGDPVKVKL